jgi:HK97 family phage portal protein
MLGRLFRREEERSAPFVVHASNGWWGWTAGDSVDALHNDAVWACVDVLASSVSELPVDVVRVVRESRLPVRPTPTLIAAPSGVVTLDVWLYQVLWSMLYDGNTFGVVTATDNRAYPTSIELVHPDCVTERAVVGAVKQAKVDGELMRAYPHGDLWHVPGKMVAPGSPFGLSPVKHAAAAINAGLSAEDFGLRFFSDGGHPSSIIYSDKELSQQQAQGIKAAYKNATQGNREPAVFGTGLKLEQVSVNPSESQFIDLQRFTVEKIARFFRVPPSMVYGGISGQAVTYANVSQSDLHYLKHSLDGYLVRIERALTALLPNDQWVHFNRNALLRTDAEGRNGVYDTRLKNRTISVNTVLALEDEPPISDPEFDEPGIPPSQNERVEAVGSLVRAGFDPAEALKAVGLPPIKHTGLVPITVQGEGVAEGDAT